MGMHGFFLDAYGIDKNIASKTSYELDFETMEAIDKFYNKVMDGESYLINTKEVDPDDYETALEWMEAIKNVATVMAVTVYKMQGQAIQEEGSQIVHILDKPHPTKANTNILMDKSYYTNAGILADKMEEELRENRKMLKHQCGWQTGIEKNDNKDNKLKDKIKKFFINLKNKIGGN